jgi:hypothetical protein
MRLFPEELLDANQNPFVFLKRREAFDEDARANAQSLFPSVLWNLFEPLGQKMNLPFFLQKGEKVTPYLLYRFLLLQGLFFLIGQVEMLCFFQDQVQGALDLGQGNASGADAKGERSRALGQYANFSRRLGNSYSISAGPNPQWMQ